MGDAIGKAALIGLLAFMIALVALSMMRSTQEQSDQKYNQQAEQPTNPRPEQHKVAKTFGERLAIIWDRTWEDPVAFFTFVLACSTGALFIATIALFISGEKSASAAKEAAEAATGAFTAALPPHMLVNDVVIEANGRREFDAFTRGAKITGVVGVVNMGRGWAKIADCYCMTYWRTGKLPMWRPYLIPSERVGQNACKPVPQTRIREGKEETISLDRKNFIQTGDVLHWQIETTVPGDYDPDQSFYILGYIVYSDQLKTRHATLFARRYDFGEGRFLPVKDNPIYEGEE